MLKKLCLLLIFFLIFCFSTGLLGDESAETYFPSMLGSFWVYEDQDGNELIREAAEKKEIPGETFHIFSYEPTFKDWAEYKHHFYPDRYQVSENGISFFVNDGIEKAIKARLTKEIETLIRVEPPPEELELSYDVIVDVEDQFFALPMPISFNEEWDTGKLTATLTIKMVDPDQIEKKDQFAFIFTIYETGNVLNKETVETPAGTFENCLKIEYRTETELQSTRGAWDESPPGESVTTLWLAPNVGIVKFHQEMEDILLKIVPDDEIPFSTTQKTLELKEYEIKSDASKTDYFPIAPGSYWVYVDNDGNELTRRAGEDEIIPAKMCNAFNYKPAIENWEDYEPYIHSGLYHIDEAGIKFYIKDEIEKAVNANFTKEMETLIQFLKKNEEKRSSSQQDSSFKMNLYVMVDSQEHFDVLPTPIPFNDEWIASKVKAQIQTVRKSDLKNKRNPVAIRNQTGTFGFTILETGKILGTETVETAAGIFEDCLKIEYRTETEMITSEQTLIENVPGESVTTLWLAPNVGIVKFHREYEKILLKSVANFFKSMTELSKTGKIVQYDDIQDIDISEFSATLVKTLELKRYEIKTADVQNNNSN